MVRTINFLLIRDNRYVHSLLPLSADETEHQWRRSRDVSRPMSVRPSVRRCLPLLRIQASSERLLPLAHDTYTGAGGRRRRRALPSPPQKGSSP